MSKTPVKQLAMGVTGFILAIFAILALFPLTNAWMRWLDHILGNVR